MQMYAIRKLRIYHYVYNINLKTGEKITNSEICALAGKEQQEAVMKNLADARKEIMDINYNPEYYKDATEREDL
ncbi:MAG: hypothetical protein K6F17_08585 [Lachnospiraceae bacterium]|nr:hypothetical protein [Lachnospiraceae bacterium]